MLIGTLYRIPRIRAPIFFVHFFLFYTSRTRTESETFIYLLILLYIYIYFFFGLRHKQYTLLMLLQYIRANIKNALTTYRIIKSEKQKKTGAVEGILYSVFIFNVYV
jgi:hypothetical protein